MGRYGCGRPIEPRMEEQYAEVSEKDICTTKFYLLRGENFMKKRFLSGVIAGLMVLLCVGCGNNNVSTSSSSSSISSAQSNQEASSRDTLNVAIMTDPEGLDPQKTSATSTYFVTTNIYEPLVVMDENWHIQSRLAESWEVADDYKSVTFHLKKGVKFHNGREMTAQDVKFSIERLHEDDSPKQKYYANITGAEIVDDYTITFTTEKPDAVLLTSFAYPWSVIVPEECADTLKTAPVGTGAYRFDNWVPQQELNLTRNEDYYDTLASIEKVAYKIVPDATSAMVGVLNGDVDLVDVTGNPVDSIQNNEVVSLYQKGINSVTILGMNLDNEYLSNELVRQAMACAINKDEIIQSVNQGNGDKVGSYLPSSAAEYIDTNDVLPYDVDHAKELMTEAGYQDGFSINLTLPKTYPMYTNIGQIIADQLEKIGIHCNIEVVEWADWMQNVYTDKNYDMTVMANSGRLSAYDFIARFRSDSGDYISYKTGEADEILDQLSDEMDPDTRTQLVQDFQRLIAEKVPVIPIETQHRIYAMNSALQGFVMYPSETTEFKLLSFSE